jgi:hypothetical protein
MQDCFKIILFSVYAKRMTPGRNHPQFSSPTKNEARLGLPAGHKCISKRCSVQLVGITSGRATGEVQIMIFFHFSTSPLLSQSKTCPPTNQEAGAGEYEIASCGSTEKSQLAGRRGLEQAADG